jgi:hypothetical protein
VEYRQSPRYGFILSSTQASWNCARGRIFESQGVGGEDSWEDGSSRGTFVREYIRGHGLSPSRVSSFSLAFSSCHGCPVQASPLADLSRLYRSKTLKLALHYTPSTRKNGIAPSRHMKMSLRCCRKDRESGIGDCPDSCPDDAVGRIIDPAKGILARQSVYQYTETRFRRIYPLRRRRVVHIAIWQQSAPIGLPWFYALAYDVKGGIPRESADLWLKSWIPSLPGSSICQPASNVPEMVQYRAALLVMTDRSLLRRDRWEYGVATILRKPGRCHSIYAISFIA